MGGCIWVASKVGEGSTFSFKIPVNASISTQGEKQDRQQRLEGLCQISILLAEDNHVNQIVFKSILSRLGYSCDICSNGKEAVDKVRTKNYDFVFMDCHMPIMNGFEATRELVKLENRPRIIALTASALQEDKDHCFRAGMDAFISKPIKVKDIEDCLFKLSSNS